MVYDRVLRVLSASPRTGSHQIPKVFSDKKIKMSFHQIKDKIIAKESRLTLSRWSGHYLPIRGATCEAKLYSEDCSVSVEFKQRKERC